jgi:hypothetical protein
MSSQLIKYENGEHYTTRSFTTCTVTEKMGWVVHVEETNQAQTGNIFVENLVIRVPRFDVLAL